MRVDFLCAIAVLGITTQSGAALAQTGSTQAQQSRYNQRILEARRYFDEALGFERQGQFHDACNYYNNARDELRDAVFSTLQFTGTYDNEQTQRDIDMVMNRARAVCGKEDTAGSWPPPSSGSSSSSSDSGSNTQSYQPDWPDMSGQVRTLQTTISAAYGYAGESSRLHAARNFAGSCAKARASAESYVKARAEAAAILKASASFRDVGTRDIQALDTNVTQSQRDAEEFYCKPPSVMVDFQAELTAFAAMKTALHLERGTVTPLASAQAVAMRSACVTDKLYASVKAGLVFADALRDSCQSFVLMYNMTLPGQACTNLTRAKTNLARVEPEHATQAKKLGDDLGALQAAFKCSVTTGGAPTTYSRPTNGGSIIQKAAEPDLPPMKLDIKPLPSRVS